MSVQTVLLCATNTCRNNRRLFPYNLFYEITNSTIHRKLAAALFRLAGTLDDAKAATEAIGFFEK
ncbi:hypothetical protein C8J56DRAFT_1059986 [Mycena floridula]|nr:hypothetical protein C8J56DRAFT_1059986 [Mycena floridula]